MSRFVFDTNVMVSALLLNDSVPGQAFIRGLNHGTILISAEPVSELSRVLGRDRFARYISHEKRDEFLQSLIREADLIEVTESVQVCRDPDDDKLPELAVSGLEQPRQQPFRPRGGGDGRRPEREAARPRPLCQRRWGTMRRVRVAAPLHLDDEAVRLAVISRLGWIRRRQAEFERQDRQSRREFVTGESHYFEGRRYRLDVVERRGAPAVRLLNNTRMGLQVRPGADREAREALLHRWYRGRLRERLPPLLAKWEPKVGERVAEVRIRKMKTRWGTCNPHARRVWLNLELAKKPPSCLEYVLVHEMAHLIERTHNDRFRSLMDALMPRWRTHRDELNQAPLAHEDWTY